MTFFSDFPGIAGFLNAGINRSANFRKNALFSFLLPNFFFPPEKCSSWTPGNLVQSGNIAVSRSKKASIKTPGKQQYKIFTL